MRKIRVFKLFAFLFFFLNLNLLYPNEKENFFELSYQSFVYTKDLENAYKIAKKANELYPENILWKERFFQICIWTNRVDEAVEVLEKIYKINTKHKLIDLNIDKIKTKKQNLYEKIMLEKLKEKKEKDLIELLNFYIENGEIDKAKKIVEENSQIIKSNEGFKKLSELYLITLELEKAVDYYKKTDQKDKCGFYLEVSKKYLAQRKFSASRDILIKNLKFCKKEPVFLQNLSDISLILNDTVNLINSTKLLYELNAYREIDAERLYIYYLHKEKEKAAEVSLNAYRKFKKGYFLYYFLATNSNLKKLEDKEVPENIYFLIKIRNLEDLDEKERKEVLKYVLSSNESEIITSYLWKIIEIGKTEEKKAISAKFNCQKDFRYAFPLSYLKLSLNKSDEAFFCFKKAIEKEVSQENYLSFAYFLENTGHKTEALFYKKLAFDYLKNKTTKDYNETKDLLLLSIDFENNSNYLDKIKKEDLKAKDTLELTLFYFSKNEMYEKIRKLIEDEKSPIWARFLIAAYDKNSGEFRKIKQENLPLRDKISFNDKFQRRVEILEDLNYLLENNTFDFENKKLAFYVKEKYIPKNHFVFNYENLNYAENFNFELSLQKYFNKNIFYEFNIKNSNYNLLSSSYLKRRQTNSSISLIINSYTWKLYTGYNNYFKNFLSYGLNKDFSIKKSKISLQLDINKPSYDSFILTLIGKESSIKSGFYIKHIKNNFLNYSINLKNYYDQQSKYLGKSIINEIGYGVHLKNLYFYPYFKTFNSSSKNSSSLVSKIYLYNTKILTDKFNETGLNFYLNENYKSFSVPLSINISYNTETYFNYSIYLIIKTKHTKTLLQEVALSHSNSSYNTKDKIYKISFSLKF